MEQNQYYTTVSIVNNGERYTLFAIPVALGTKRVQIVSRLLEYAKSKVRIRKVLMDRGFFGVGVIDYLNRNNIKFVMPAVRNWRVQRLANSVDAPHVCDFKMRDEWAKATTLFKLAFVKVDDTKYVFATNIDITSESAIYISEEYRKRWGIETSYRVKESFRARTTSKNYVIRLFYFLFSLTLYNIWVIVNAMLSVFLFGRNSEKPLVTAKIVGTLLMTIEIT